MSDRVLNDIYSIRIPTGRRNTIASPYCESCKNGVVHLSSLEVRRFSQSGQLPNVCKNCNKEFLKICRIQIRNMNQPESLHACELCGKSFIHAGNLKKHKQLHKENEDAGSSEDINFVPVKAESSESKSDYLGFQNRSCLCKECDKQFPNEYAFLKHCQFHVNNDEQHVCLVCNMLFDGSMEYKAHMMSHEEKSEYVCSICPITFVKISELKLHCLNIHEKKNAVQSKNSVQLNASVKKENELQNGSGRQKYACDRCDKTFVQKPAFVKHCQLHDISSPNFCTACQKLFPSSEEMEEHKPKCEHMEVMHEILERPGRRQRYTCKVCDKGFKLRTTYMKHRRSHK